jgi:hypothetical protein
MRTVSADALPILREFVLAPIGFEQRTLELLAFRHIARGARHGFDFPGRADHRHQ